MKKSFLAFVLMFVVASCAPATKRGGMELNDHSFSRLSGWNEKNATEGFRAFRKNCAALNSKKLRSEKLFSENKRVWQDKCIKSRNSTSAKSFFEDNFKPYLVTYQGGKNGLFTGYFEKEIEASLRKSDVYKHPIYRVPDDPALLNLSRKQIDNGALSGKNLEIAYAKSAAALFFLQIQGSGILKLPDGKRIKIGFAGKNNKEYTSIGRHMLSQRFIKNGTAGEIEEWLDRHPVSARSIMNMNERFIFFSLKGDGGPYGSLGVELTGLGSMAVDPKYIPLGVPVWVQTTIPGVRVPLTKLLMAQDTGGAITGVIRGDIFFGSGGWAEDTAGIMKQAGSYFILLPKEIDPRLYF